MIKLVNHQFNISKWRSFGSKSQSPHKKAINSMAPNRHRNSRARSEFSLHLFNLQNRQRTKVKYGHFLTFYGVLLGSPNIREGASISTGSPDDIWTGGSKSAKTP